MTAPEQATVAWVRRFVIGLGMCPFAALPFHQGTVFTVECPEATTEAAFYWAGAQVRGLLATPPTAVETVLLVFSGNDLLSFDAFLDFVAELEYLLEASGTSEEVQLAHFHPTYRFAGVPADDPGNATNRSPYPTVQLLRVKSVTAAVAAHGRPEKIPQRNVALLRQRPELIALRRDDL